MLNNDCLEKEPLIKVNITDADEVGTYEIIVSDASYKFKQMGIPFHTIDKIVEC